MYSPLFGEICSTIWTNVAKNVPKFIVKWCKFFYKDFTWWIIYQSSFAENSSNNKSWDSEITCLYWRKYQDLIIILKIRLRLECQDSIVVMGWLRMASSSCNLSNTQRIFWSRLVRLSLRNLCQIISLGPKTNKWYDTLCEAMGYKVLRLRKLKTIKRLLRKQRLRKIAFSLKRKIESNLTSSWKSLIIIKLS